MGDEHSKGSATDDAARGLEPAMLTSSCAESGQAHVVVSGVIWNFDLK